jgi:thioredoxin reductase (NADPH)
MGGVSHALTCDGFFFRGLEVAVVGGGDTAMEESNFLTRFAPKVTLIHRRDSLRASKIMADRAARNPKISFIWNTEVVDIIGKEENGKKSLTALKLKNHLSGEVSEFKTDGLFIGIGHQPNTDIFKGQISLNENGYILTKPRTTETNVPGVFAAGDVADSVYRQAVTAAGSGCMAAIDAEKFLEAHHV